MHLHKTCLTTTCKHCMRSRLLSITSALLAAVRSQAQVQASCGRLSLERTWCASSGAALRQVCCTCLHLSDSAKVLDQGLHGFDNLWLSGASNFNYEMLTGVRWLTTFRMPSAILPGRIGHSSAGRLAFVPCPTSYTSHLTGTKQPREKLNCMSASAAPAAATRFSLNSEAACASACSCRTSLRSYFQKSLHQVLKESHLPQGAPSCPKKMASNTYTCREATGTKPRPGLRPWQAGVHLRQDLIWWAGGVQTSSLQHALSPGSGRSQTSGRNS